MGSMADAANAPEKKTEVSETLNQGAASVEETVSELVALPASVPEANPKAPSEVKDDQVEVEGEVIVQEPPEKKARLLKRRWEI
jgi:hypothetical protein